MPDPTSATRKALIRSGKQEFLEHGFKQASLRTICARASVTTGAFYVYFAKKDDLFRAIVEEELAEYFERYDGMMSRLAAGVADSEDNEIEFMDYLIEHRDLFQLLFERSEGSSYEGFKDDLIARFEQSYQTFLDSHAKEPVDHEVTKTLVAMKFAQYVRMLFGGYTKEEVRRITEQIQIFTGGGTEALLQTTFERPA